MIVAFYNCSLSLSYLLVQSFLTAQYNAMPPGHKAETMALPYRILFLVYFPLTREPLSFYTRSSLFTSFSPCLHSLYLKAPTTQSTPKQAHIPLTPLHKYEQFLTIAGPISQNALCTSYRSPASPLPTSPPAWINVMLIPP